MATVDLFPEFKEFLGSLNSAKVEYLVVGGYAVVHYGHRRVTDDLDVWIAVKPANTRRVAKVLQTFFGFSATAVEPILTPAAGKVFIFGREPARIDILTGPDGLEFDSCYARRNTVTWDRLKVPLISLVDLKLNKLASGRAKDLSDVEHLPAAPDAPPRVTVAKKPRKKKRRKPPRS